MWLDLWTRIDGWLNRDYEEARPILILLLRILNLSTPSPAQRIYRNRDDLLFT
jgi:hypothetical protein